MKYYEVVKQIDRDLSGRFTTVKRERLLALIREDQSYQNYFFKNVYDIKWFDPLQEHGYFNPEHAPKPTQSKKEGHYMVPWWNVLSFLEKVAEQVRLRRNAQYIDKLLKIIIDVSRYTDLSDQHIDNFHTWRSFVTILLNIPRDKTPMDVIELIPTWLDSKFEASHVGSIIGLDLLPHFLSGDSSSEDISKAEKIVDYLTDVKSIKLDEEKASIFDRGDRFKLKVDSFYVKEVFEKHSKNIGEKCTNNIIHTLSNRIRGLLKRDESLIPFETDSKAYLLALSSDNGICSVEVFDVGDKTEFKVYEQVFKMKKREGNPLKALPFDETSLDDFKSKVFNFLIQDEPFKSSNARKLKRDIHNLYCNYYDSATYASLYDESRTHLTEPLEVLTFALKSILMLRAKKYIEKTKEILKQFLEDKYLYFPKMALYIIGNNINAYSDVFWEALEKDNSNLIFGEIYFGDELRHVLENISQLSNPQKTLIFKKLNDGPGYVHEEDVERQISEWKQERSKALMKFPEFKELYESLKSETGVDVGLHPAAGEIKTRWGGGQSPLTKEEILKKLTINKLPSFLHDFKSKGFWDEGPSVSGLAQIIKECTAENPSKFIEKLPSFIDTWFIYIYEILEGTREAWNKKQDIPWGKLFKFIHKYIDKDREDFWKDKLIVEKDEWRGGANHLWIVGAVTELIKGGTRNDSWAFNEKYLKEAEEILFLIFDNLEVEEEEDKSDYVTHALNSPYGKTIDAFINFALRIARLKDQKADKAQVKWSKEIKGKYDELLEKKIIESYALLGRYLPNLYYLDKAWANEKVKSLNLETADCYWEAFMDGYLSIGQVHEMLFDLMSPHYRQGMTVELKGKRNNQHLIQHISLGYLFEYKKFDDPENLFKKVLETWNTEHILYITDFFWSQQRYLKEGSEKDEKIIEKIIFLWRWIYENQYKNKSEIAITDDNDKKILSSLARLTIYLDSINDESSNWLMLSAPFAKENHNSSFFIECLDKFSDPTSISYIGKIYLKMLDHFMPDFDEKHIRSIVEKLYANGPKDAADNICNTYGMKGNDFLRDLYDKYNKTE